MLFLPFPKYLNTNLQGEMDTFQKLIFVTMNSTSRLGIEFLRQYVFPTFYQR